MSALPEPPNIFHDVLLGSLPLFGSVLVGREVSKQVDSAWYAGLAKPAWYPPRIVFPVVWTVLYVLMGAAFAIAVRHRNASPWAPWALAAFIAQLLLNYLWSVVFFKWHSVRTALFVLLALVAAVVATAALMYAAGTPVAALLLLPYLAWLAFALALNWKVYALNKADA